MDESDKNKKKRSKEDGEDDEEWQPIKRFASDNDRKNLSSRHLANNQKRACRSLYWLLVNPVFNKETKNATLIHLDNKQCIVICPTRRTRIGVLNYLEVTSVTCARPLAYSTFKKMCEEIPSSCLLMNRDSSVCDRLMCVKYLAKKFPSMLIGQGLDGSFTEIPFSGTISTMDVENAVNEYAKNEIKNKVQELKVSVAASSYNNATLKKSIKKNLKHKCLAFMLDSDEQLERMKIFCKENKNTIAAAILYENLVCLFKFFVPIKIKRLTSAIQERTSIIVENKGVYTMMLIEARKFLDCHQGITKVYKHGNILQRTNTSVSSKTFIVRKTNKQEFTQEQLLYLINNPKVKTMLLSDTQGAIWCSKVLSPNDIYFGGNKEILDDIVFDSISDTQFDRFRSLENITTVKKTLDYKKSIKPFVNYPFRNKRDRYRYFLSNPDVIDEKTARGYVENGTMSSSIKVRIPDCNSIILKSDKYIKLADVPNGLVPIDKDSARYCSDKTTFQRLKNDVNVNSKGRTWIIEKLKGHDVSDLHLHFDKQLQAHVYESPTKITLETVLLRLQSTSVGNIRLATESEIMNHKCMIRLDFNLVPFHIRHEFARALLKIEPELTVMFESPAEMEGMIISTFTIKSNRSPHYYFYEVCRNTSLGLAATLTRIQQSKKIRNKIYQRNKYRVCWMFCLHGDNKQLTERLPQPLGFYTLKDNRCVFRTSMADELVVPHLLENGLIEKYEAQLCLKISRHDVLNLMKHGIVSFLNISEMLENL